MQKTTIATFLLCLAQALSLFAQTTRPVIQTYRNLEHGFQMDYLTTWKPEAGNRPWMVTRFSPSDPEDVRLSRAAIGVPQIATRPIKLEDVVTYMIAEFKLSMPDATVGVAVDTTLGGEPARRMVITGTSVAHPVVIPLRAVVIATVHKDKAYVVGILAPQDEWDRLRDGFDRLVRTFTFIEPTK